MKKFIWVYITTANKKEAIAISEALLKKKLVACANIFPPILSLYVWQGSSHKSKEVAVLLKTTQAKFSIIEKEIKKLHSYKVPCIISIPWRNGHKPFLNWVKNSIN